MHICCVCIASSTASAFFFSFFNCWRTSICLGRETYQNFSPSSRLPVVTDEEEEQFVVRCARRHHVVASSSAGDGVGRVQVLLSRLNHLASARIVKHLRLPLLPGMQAAARSGAAAVAASAAFHSTAAALSKSTPHIRFNVREKRADAKSALKNLLLNGSPSQERSNKQMRQQKVGGKSKVRSGSGNNPHSKSKRGQNWRNFDEDDCSATPYGSFGGKTSFTWYWPGENDNLGSSPSGFQWREEPQSTKSRERVWNESDVEEEEESRHDDLKSHRISLGLPLLGPLKLEHIKSVFRASALKWHPDKHQGSSKADAEEKFRGCVEAYNALAGAFKSNS